MKNFPKVHRPVFTFFFCLVVLILSGQEKCPCLEIENYIPAQEADYQNVPIKEINLLFHVIPYSKEEPRTYLPEQRDYLHKQVDLVNRFYRDLQEPSLKIDRPVPVVPDSRIRFKLDSVIFHEPDSVAWNRRYLQPYRKNKAPWAIDTIRGDTAFFTAAKFYLIDRAKKFVLLGPDNKQATLTKKKVQYDRRRYWVTFEESIPSVSWDSLTFLKEVNLNCRQDNYMKYAVEDKDHVHIFYTGATISKTGFGCGPSMYWLNMSNTHRGGEWANAQLLAHELGHTLGLMHTNTGQFDDFNKNDKYGFHSCNSTDISNNIMGYNKCRNYLSPKQIGHLHRKYSTEEKRIRTLTFSSQHDGSLRETTKKEETWSCPTFITGDLYIPKKCTLRISCHAYVNSKTKITLGKKSKLIIDGGKLNNPNEQGCGGVKQQKKRKRAQGKIILENGGSTNLKLS